MVIEGTAMRCRAGPEASARAGLSAQRQPITWLMRAMHRASLLVPAEPHRLRNAKPLVSFTFDDVPDSAVRTGARILESVGARGTFFVATSLFGSTTPDWRVAEPAEVAEVADRGHEVGLHSHRHLPAAHMGAKAFEADMHEAARRLAPIARGASAENYAYPFGFSSPVHRRCLQRRVRSSRTTHPGINRDRVDTQALRSYAVGEALSAAADIDQLLDRVAAQNGWLIFTLHDVRPDPSPYGCTPSLLRHAVEGALSRNVSVATMAEALDACGVPKCG